MQERSYRKPVARFSYLNSRTSNFLEQILVIASMVIDDDSGGVMIEHLFTIPDIIPAVKTGTQWTQHFFVGCFNSTTSLEHGLMIHQGCLTNYATPCSYTSCQMNT